MTEQLSKAFELIDEVNAIVKIEYSKFFWELKCASVGLIGPAAFVVLNEFSILGNSIDNALGGGDDVVIVNEKHIAIQSYNDNRGRPYYYSYVLDDARGVAEADNLLIEPIIDIPKIFEGLYKKKILQTFESTVNSILKDENRYAFKHIMKNIKNK